ncbi:MAG: hypothetical protein ACJ8AH_11115 [Stellaceae bacterium]
MNRIIRGICSKLGKALVVCAFALTFLSATSLTADSQEPHGAEHLQPNPNGNTDVGVRGHGFMAEGGVFTIVDAPGAGAFTAVFGIDDRGAIVGGYVDQRGMLHGFIHRNDRFTTVDFPGARATVLARGNAQGQIVGAYSDDANAPTLKLSHGFLWHNGVFTTIAVPGAVRTQPFGINNQGQIVGEYVDAEGRSHGFLLHRGVVTTIDAPDSTDTIASDIDDSGRMVGTFVAAVPGSGLAGGFRGFLRDAAGVFTTIDVPNADPTGDTNAVGINWPVAVSPEG